MLPSIVSLLFGCATTIERKPTPPGEQQKAKPSARSSAASKGTTCAKSTPHSARQNQLKFFLDEHSSINAAVETFCKTIKAELVWRRTWDARLQAETTNFQYINGSYNPRRRYSALGGKSPLSYERQAA
jgi:transposase InsO family protein